MIHLLSQPDGLNIALKPILGPAEISSTRKSRAELEASRAHIRKQAAEVASELSDQRTMTHEGSGRPALMNSDLDVSISHKTDLVAAAVYPKPYRVGLDIESFDAVEDIELFARHSLTPAEIAGLERFEEHFQIDRRKSVITHWAFKESLYKALGLPHNPQHCSIHLSDGQFTCALLMQGRWMDICFKEQFVRHLPHHVVVCLVADPDQLSTAVRQF